MTKAVTQETKPLTPLQTRFVAAFIGKKGDASKAVVAAGSKTKHPASLGWQMLQKPHVRQAIRDAALETLSLPMMVKALKRLNKLVDSKDERVALAAATDVLDRAAVRAADQGANVPFKGTIRIDFRSPTERAGQVGTSADGTQRSEPVEDRRGGKGGVPHHPTSPLPPTEKVIEGEFEEV